VFRYPLSLAGTAVILLAGAAWWIGRARMDLVLTLVGLWAWVLAGCLGLAAGIGLWRLRRAVRRAAEAGAGETRRGVEDRPMDGLTGLELPRLPLVGRPLLAWEVPEAEARLIDVAGTWRESVVPRMRARAGSVTRRLEVRDVLGLWRWSCRIPGELAIRVLPETGRLEPSALESCLASGDLLPHPFGPAEGDRVDARPYTPSDPARMILWKVYARSRELLVRTPEPARAPERAPLLYLVAGPEDGAAAATARVLCEGRLLSEGAHFAADGTPEPVGDPEAALDAVARSGGYRDRGGEDLAAALEAAAAQGLDGVVLICPAQPGPWLRHVERALAGGAERFLVISAGDAATPAAPRPLWQRALIRPVAQSGPTFAQMLRWSSLWTRWGARAVVVDRRSGRLEALSGGTPAPSLEASA
jgi:hypothetical protein